MENHLDLKSKKLPFKRDCRRKKDLSTERKIYCN